VHVRGAMGHLNCTWHVMRPLVPVMWHVMCPLILTTGEVIGAKCDKVKEMEQRAVREKL
jgi:hypothetical protein